MKIDPLVLQPHQARRREPSAYENQLADAMERAFSQGLWELDQLVDSLNQQGVTNPEGAVWTAAAFEMQIQKLSQG
jgi:hypothetical protein